MLPQACTPSPTPSRHLSAALRPTLLERSRTRLSNQLPPARGLLATKYCRGLHTHLCRTLHLHSPAFLFRRSADRVSICHSHRRNMTSVFSPLVARMLLLLLPPPPPCHRLVHHSTATLRRAPIQSSVTRHTSVTRQRHLRRRQQFLS